MGRPFEKELGNLEKTYNWSLNANISPFENFIENSLDRNMLIVGSGGSLSACYLAEQLHELCGSMSKHITPLELLYSRKIIRSSNVLFISAGGRNKDILSAFNTSIEEEPKAIFGLCMREKTKLSLEAKKYSISEVLELKLPSGKDGFLATNSLLAYFVVLVRAYQRFFENTFPKKIILDKNYLDNINDFVSKINPETTISVLYGGWGTSVAVDLESKFTESALGNLHTADYRNFGHGRHHWFAKRGKNSAIVALVTPKEKQIAEKTLSLLPSTINKLIIDSNETSPIASIELLMKSFYFINQIGKMNKIDPGRPGVPSYGSRLYHINLNTFYAKNKKSKFTKQKEFAIKRKANINDLSQLSESDLRIWSDAYDNFIKNLNQAKFGGIVFDYDGTLCSGNKEERFNKPCNEIDNELLKLLKNDILIGIATGRGKSVREALQKSIPQKYWNKVVIGYYNGSDIGLLNDNKCPDKTREMNPSLIEIKNLLEKDKLLSRKIKTDPRPDQLTVDIIDKSINIYIIIDFITRANIKNIKVVESSHSLDIITQNVSKLNLVNYCRNVLKEQAKDVNILCIGDRGRWPGNDYQLLNETFSLSVDEVSQNLRTCWNLVKEGNKNVIGILEYLRKLNFNNNMVLIKF